MYSNLGQGGLLNLGSIGPHGWFVMISHGLAHSLLQHDMIQEYLLHFYSHSAHDYTRGTWTTPEGVGLDSSAGFDEIYATPGELTVPIYLRWALLFEDPEDRALWLFKALPREWLRGGGNGTEPVVVLRGAPTRYGNLSVALKSNLGGDLGGGGGGSGGGGGGGRRSASSNSSTAVETVPAAAAACTVEANISVPARWATGPGGASSTPPGGLFLRLRAPTPHAGKLVSVTVGGALWPAAHVVVETVAFPRELLTAKTIIGLESVVATFGGC
jgi:hypothetical protein